jgi:hypothetical protein
LRPISFDSLSKNDSIDLYKEALKAKKSHGFPNETNYVEVINGYMDYRYKSLKGKYAPISTIPEINENKILRKVVEKTDSSM